MNFSLWMLQTYSIHKKPTKYTKGKRKPKRHILLPLMFIIAFTFTNSNCQRLTNIFWSKLFKCYTEQKVIFNFQKNIHMFQSIPEKIGMMGVQKE